MRHAIVFTVTLALVGPPLVHAESLGEVAAREREKKKGKPSGKVITESDLGKRHGRGNYNNPDDHSAVPDETQPGAAAPAPAVAGADASKEKPKSPEEIRADAQAEWRQRLDAANKRVSDLQALVTRLEGRPNLYADAQAQADLQQTKKELADAQKQITDLETERRQRGYR
jgi:hypothetical protein